MIADDKFSDLPAEPELAFVQLEREFRNDLTNSLEASESGNASDTYYLEYMNNTLAAARALNLDILKGWEVPSSDRQLWDAYRRFKSDVDHYTIQIRIHHSRRARGYSVALDSVTKQKIRHHLNQIKEVVDRLEVSPAKQEALYAKINALSEEVDRDRTKFEALAALSIEVASTGGEAARQLNPIREWIDSIARLVGLAKDAENARPTLPAPGERKRLEPPRRQLQGPEQLRVPGPDLDDEIPF
jgi:hypothetical protein